MADKQIADLPQAEHIRTSDNLVLEQEGTAKKLSGEALAEFCKEKFSAEEIAAYLGAHPEATTTVQDGSITRQKLSTTLAQEITKHGSDIDVLDSRVDQILGLPEGSTTADAELTDIRIGADGTTYETAGDAVRGQVSQLLESITEIATFDKTYPNIFDISKREHWKQLDGNGGTPTVSGLFDISNYIELPKTEGKLYFYGNTSNESQWINRYEFYDSSKTFVSGGHFLNPLYTQDKYAVIPENASFFRFSYSTDKIVAVYVDTQYGELIPFGTEIDGGVRLNKTVSIDVESIPGELKDEVSGNSAEIEKLKSRNAQSLKPLYVEMYSQIWMRGEVQGIENTDYFIVDGSVGGNTVTVTGGSVNISNVTNTLWGACVEYDDGTHDMLIVTAIEGNEVTVYPRLKKTVTNQKFCALLGDSQHLTEMGYYAFAEMVWSQKKKYCDKTKYADRWSPSSYVADAVPYTRLAGSPQFYGARRGDYNKWSMTYNPNGIALIPYIDYLNDGKYGVTRDITLDSINGYYEVFVGTVFVSGTTDVNKIEKDDGYEIYIDWYLDGELAKSVVKHTNHSERFCFDFNSENSNAKIEIYYKKMRKNIDCLSVGDSTVWITDADKETELVPKHVSVGEFFDSWGEFWNGETEYNEQLEGWASSINWKMGASSKGFSSQMSKDNGVETRIKNRSHSGATTRWAKAWIYETMLKAKPKYVLMDFGINDYHTNQVSTFTDEQDPYGNTISMRNPVTFDEYKENVVELLSICIANDIVPIWIGGSIAQDANWIFDTLSYISSKEW